MRASTTSRLAVAVDWLEWNADKNAVVGGGGRGRVLLTWLTEGLRWGWTESSWMGRPDGVVAVRMMRNSAKSKGRRNLKLFSNHDECMLCVRRALDPQICLLPAVLVLSRTQG